MHIRGLMTVAVVSFAMARAARAQSGSQGSLVPIANRTYIGFNPMGIPFDIFTGEIESGVAQGITLGGTASHIDVDAQRYTSFDFKARYYPGEVVLRGFSLGASAGFLSYSSTPSTGLVEPNGQIVDGRQTLTTPTIGVLADYNWLLGSDHRFLVGTGLGAKRILASSDDRDRVGLDRAYVTARFTVGLAF